MSARTTAIAPYWFTLRMRMQQRGEWIGALSAAAFVAVLVVVLGNLYLALADGKTISGYDGKMLVWYVAIAESAVVALNGRLIARIGEEIKFGDIISILLRPLSFPWYRVAGELGSSLLQACAITPVALAVAWAIAGPPPSWWLLLTLPLTIPLAITVNALLLVAMGALTFWTGETRTTWFLYQKLTFLAGGMIPPLEFWPGRVGDVLAVLPWASTAYAPAYLGVHAWSPVDFVRIVGLQLVWVGLAAAFMTWLHTRGERLLVTEGG